jgi:hypothetical protein
MKDASGVDVEDPGIFLEGLPEFTRIVVVEAIYICIAAHNFNDLIVVVSSRRHDDLPFAQNQYRHMPARSSMIPAYAIDAIAVT